MPKDSIVNFSSSTEVTNNINRGFIPFQWPKVCALNLLAVQRGLFHCCYLTPLCFIQKWTLFSSSSSLRRFFFRFVFLFWNALLLLCYCQWEIQHWLLSPIRLSWLPFGWAFWLEQIPGPVQRLSHHTQIKNYIWITISKLCDQRFIASWSLPECIVIPLCRLLHRPVDFSARLIYAGLAGRGRE